MTPELQNTIDYAISGQDSPSAIRVLSMAKADPSLGVDQNTVNKLRYIRMNSLTVEQLLSLMHDSILAAYTIPEFDLEQRLRDYNESLDNVAEEVKLNHGILKVLDESLEELGTTNINLKNTPVKPTLGNWIEDFSTFPSATREKDALAEFEYTNKSPNVKLLKAEEKAVLKNIIKFYDEAVNRISLFDAIKLPQSEAELYKDYDLYKLIPGLEDDLAEEAEYKKRLAQTPQQKFQFAEDDPRHAEELRRQSVQSQTPLDAIPSSRTSNPDINRVPQTLRRQSVPVQTQLEPVKRQEEEKVRNVPEPQPAPVILARPGIVIDPTNVRVEEEKERLAVENQQKMTSIQKKLADLKARRKINPPE